MSGRTGGLQNFNTLCKEIRQLGFKFWIKFGHLATKKKNPFKYAKKFCEKKKNAKVIKDFLFYFLNSPYSDNKFQQIGKI